MHVLTGLREHTDRKTPCLRDVGDRRWGWRQVNGDPGQWKAVYYDEKPSISVVIL